MFQQAISVRHKEQHLALFIVEVKRNMPQLFCFKAVCSETVDKKVQKLQINGTRKSTKFSFKFKPSNKKNLGKSKGLRYENALNILKIYKLM